MEELAESGEGEGEGVKMENGESEGRGAVTRIQSGGWTQLQPLASRTPRLESAQLQVNTGRRNHCLLMAVKSIGGRNRESERGKKKEKKKKGKQERSAVSRSGIRCDVHSRGSEDRAASINTRIQAIEQLEGRYEDRYSHRRTGDNCNS